jgi:hypothetical protein
VLRSSKVLQGTIVSRRAENTLFFVMDRVESRQEDLLLGLFSAFAGSTLKQNDFNGSNYLEKNGCLADSERLGLDWRECLCSGSTWVSP